MKKEELYSGKAKTIYKTDDPSRLIAEFRDSLTAFDGKKKSEAAKKGYYNAQISKKIFEMLEKEGISAEVIDLQTLRPMDISTVVESLKKTHRAVIVEEDWPQCGIGAQIVDQLQYHAFDYLDAPIIRVTQADTPIPYSRDLELSALPDEAKVVSAVKNVLSGI